MQAGLNKTNQVKAISKRFAATTAVYGLNHIIKAKDISMKLVWTLMTLSSLIAGLYIIIQTIVDYHEHTVLTQTKRIHPLSTALPAVTFCSDATDLNRLLQDAMFKTKDEAKNLTRGYVHEMAVENVDIRDYNCIKFNNHIEERTNEDEEFYCSTDPSDHFWFSMDMSVQFTHLDLFISDNYDNIIDWSHHTPGVGYNRGKYYIDLTKSMEQKLASPFNDCQNMPETYRRANCVEQCENERFTGTFECALKNYHSADPRHASHPGKAYCSSDIVNKSLKGINSECQLQCPQECTSIKFESVISNYLSAFDSNDSLVFSIAYSDLSYIRISQTPKITGVSVMSNIGGTLGLFIGIRFLSMIELVEYLTEVYHVFYGK